MNQPLVLRLDTVEGAEDVLAAELSSAGNARPAGPGIVELRGADSDTLETEVDRLTRLTGARCFTGVAVPLEGVPGDPAFEQSLGRVIMLMEAAGLSGDRGFRIAERSAAERDSAAALITEATGWQQQSGNWVINLTADPDGWAAQLGPLHWSRRNGRLQRLPWSTPAALADVLVRMAKVRPGHRVLDPCCGSGTLLVAAGLVGAAELLGADRYPDAVSVAKQNLTTLGLDGTVTSGDAEELASMPLGSGVDRVISNLPFGKQVGSHRNNERLYPALLAGVARQLVPDGRAVLLTEDKRLFLDSLQRTRGLKIVKQSGFRYSGATPTAYVMTHRRR